MAFGQSMKKSQETQTEGDQKRDWYWLDLHSGVRVFRILPEVDQFGNFVFTDGHTQPESEISWYEAWWTVIAGGNEVKRRIFLPNQFDNPLWRYVQENYEKGSPERKLVKQRFGVNVYDVTKVLFNEEGLAIYPDEKGKYMILATGKKLEVEAKGDPVPHNKILILEGSAGKAGGKHLLNQLFELTGNIDNPHTGEVATLSEVDLRVKTTGEKISTVRNFFPSSNFKPLPEDVVKMPRWDIASWVKPWTDDAIERLIAGEDFNEIVEEYGIQLFPKLQVRDTVEDTSDPKKSNKVSKPRSGREPKMDNEEALFDD